jgi:hypothetical protein
MAIYTLAELVTVSTAERIYDESISIAETLRLPVTTWHAGDETRSQYWCIAEHLAAFDAIVAGYTASAFLDLVAANSDYYAWLVLRAEQEYGYIADEATYASCTVRLTNDGGALYDGIEPGDITAKSTTSDKTYHNTTGGTLASGPATTLDLTFEADEAGSASSAAPGEIDALVTTMNLVTCSNTTAATGTDAESAASIVSGCRAKLAALSAEGPPGIYDFVACSVALTGAPAVTRSRTYGDSVTGDVTQYLAGPSGAIADGAVTLVTAAIARWATPLCITPTITSAANLVVPITYELWLYDSIGMTEDEVEDAVATALAAFFVARPIGGDIKAAIGVGRVFHSAIESVFKTTFGVHFMDVHVTAPGSDQGVTLSQVPVLGTITVTDVHFEEAP